MTHVLPFRSSFTVGQSKIVAVFLPDLPLVLPVEKVLPAHPLGHDELQGRFPCRSRQAAQKLQQRFQLRVNQVGKHHDQRLEREEKQEVVQISASSGTQLK